MRPGLHRGRPCIFRLATLTAILEEDPPDLAMAGRASGLAGIVRRCMQKGVDDRFASAHDLAVALETVLERPGQTAAVEAGVERRPYPGLEADVHVLLSLRDDFLMRCSEHERLARVFTKLTSLPPLTREGLWRALVEPAKTEGFRFEDDALVEEMLAAVEGARGALPLLAFAVSRLWEKRDRERKLLTRAAYEEIGGVAGALAQHAEATLDRIGLERQEIVREIFRNLVTAQWTRAVIDRQELLSVFPDRRSAEEVLGALVDARLLTSYEVPSAEGKEPRSHHRVEIVHESLLKGVAASREVAGAGRGGFGPAGPAEAGGAPLGGEGAAGGSPVDGKVLPGVRAVARAVRGATLDKLEVGPFLGWRHLPTW